LKEVKLFYARYMRTNDFTEGSKILLDTENNFVGSSK